MKTLSKDELTLGEIIIQERVRLFKYRVRMILSDGSEFVAFTAWSYSKLLIKMVRYHKFCLQYIKNNPWPIEGQGYWRPTLKGYWDAFNEQKTIVSWPQWEYIIILE